ncbi:MAG TPA: hypothetical protein VKA18_09420, partial [Alphaproteobacteria bacterium]|nr:hypothetical protein [Alphaproteobacteria bacterium]
MISAKNNRVSSAANKPALRWRAGSIFLTCVFTRKPASGKPLAGSSNDFDLAKKVGNLDRRILSAVGAMSG